MPKKSDNTGYSFLAYFKRDASPIEVARSGLVDGRACLLETLTDYRIISGIFDHL